MNLRNWYRSHLLLVTTVALTIAPSQETLAFSIVRSPSENNVSSPSSLGREKLEAAIITMANRSSNLKDEQEVFDFRANGIEFETVIDNDSIPIPDPESNLRVFVRFGVQITNTTSQVVQFDRMPYPRLNLQISSLDGSLASEAVASNGFTASITEECPFTVEPGERKTLWGRAFLFWENGNLRMQGHPWVEMNNLDAGEYIAQFNYYSPGGLTLCHDYETERAEIVDDLWSGNICSRPVTFSLIDP